MREGRAGQDACPGYGPLDESLDGQGGQMDVVDREVRRCGWDVVGLGGVHAFTIRILQQIHICRITLKIFSSCTRWVGSHIHGSYVASHLPSANSLRERVCEEELPIASKLLPRLDPIQQMLGVGLD